MKVLVVSDTHGRDENLEEVLIQESPFDLFVHCGDVEGREIFLEAAVDCPACMVAGNNDFFSDLPREDVVVLGKHRVFVTHGHTYGVSWEMDELLEAAKSRKCDVVLFGHTHYPMIRKFDDVLAINPGSLTYPRQSGRRPSYAVLTVDSTDTIHAEIVYL
jgi:hypothetical protein